MVSLKIHFELIYSTGTRGWDAEGKRYGERLARVGCCWPNFASCEVLMRLLFFILTLGYRVEELGSLNSRL